jgi:hypothetical protein
LFFKPFKGLFIMDLKKRLLALSAIVVTVFLGFVAWQIKSGTASAAPVLPKIQIQENKPIEGWVVCKDLGIGTVPGVSGTHQRIRLCHQDGWVVNTYCLRPDLPVPMLGGLCTRVSEDTYNCGRGLQPLKEYQVRQTPTVPSPLTDTPTSTQTNTPTQTPTSTQTQTQTPTPTNVPEIQPTETSTPIVMPTRPVIPYQTPTIPVYRPSPGGFGFRQLLHQVLEQINPFTAASQAPLPSPTPFRPLHPTVTPPSVMAVDPAYTYLQFPTATQSNLYQAPGVNSDIIQFVAWQSPVSIRLKPANPRLNGGKPIQIVFNADTECQFGDGNACVNKYRDRNGAEITFITVHSGIGGEAQPLRNALEGTGFDQAALPLSQVRKNLQALLGSEVIIKQGDSEQADLEIVAAVRLPARLVRDYINTPVSDALTTAAQYDPDLSHLIDSGQPLIVVETCGWRLPGEPNPDNLPDTSASIYLIVIKLKP